MTQKRQYVVVDDDHLNNMLCSICIRKQDPEAVIHTFTNPVLGLKFLQGNSLDGAEETIVFLDINMPSMSGWDFMDQYSQIDPTNKSKTKIYFLTTAITEEDNERSSRIPEIVSVLLKPLKLDKLKH